MPSSHPKPLIISGYTINTPYETVVKNLEKSLVALSLEHKIFPYGDQGNWLKNCNMKPQIISAALLTFQRPVIWIDCDAVVESCPHLFYQGAILQHDIAYHLKDGKELLSGTLFINDTVVGNRIANEWVTKAMNQPSVFDQKLLAELMVKQTEAKVFALPASYCKIFDSMAYAESVVVHYQASRRFRDRRLET